MNGIVNSPASGTGAPAAEPFDQRITSADEIEHMIQGRNTPQSFGLGYGSRKTVENEAPPGILPFQAFLHHGHRNLIGYQIPPLHDRPNPQTQRGSRLDILPEESPRRDMGNLQQYPGFFSYRTFAGPWRTKKH